jgi:anaerobic nitric oxide reductase transcription regulator
VLREGYLHQPDGLSVAAVPSLFRSLRQRKMTRRKIKAGASCHATDALLEVALGLTASLSTAKRYQRLLAAVRSVVPCDAVALLRFRDGCLVPVAIEGLTPDTLGRCFEIEEHPRLKAILGSRAPVKFAADDPRPDPYDGLIEKPAESDIRVHSCMGCSLYVGDDLVGALTLDALKPGLFDRVDDRQFAIFAALAAAAMRTAGLIDSLQEVAERRGMVARQMVVDALQREGGELLGQSPAMLKLKKEISFVAESDLTMLITGETGTGKELVARTVHARSPRAGQPLVYVNCAALVESIAESELFGHVKGAFTGALGNRPGKFELAHGGTLFLDEIGELPLSVQPKLLRALQSGEIQRVGADRNIKVDVRVLAATNRVLAEEVKTGRFRADLYHRLSVYPVQVPPLRERNGDIALLAGHFLDRARIKLGLGRSRFAAAARRQLDGYSWPGNVRELEHVVMRAALRASAGRRGEEVTVGVNHLDLPSDDTSGENPLAKHGDAAIRDMSLKDAMDAFKREYLNRTVSACDGNWAEAARRLRVDRANLYRLANRLGLK